MKLHSAAAERNRGPILEVLREVLPPSGVVLEIASGTGQHAAYFAEHLPGITWQPSDVDPGALASIAAWRADAALPNLRAPIALDVKRGPWPTEPIAAVVCSNMIHIAPWAACEGLFAGAGPLLAVGAPLVLYGPFRIESRPTAPSNEGFDASLRHRDPAWGLRRLGDVTRVAAGAGFERERLVDMPANNVTVVFRKSF